MNNCDTVYPAEKRKFLSISNTAKVLLLCFFVPFISMIVIYCFLMVWPVGKNSVLVLDLSAQYACYLEEFRNIITEGDSLLYSFNRALGGEFMGIFAYYLSSPFSFIVALFPKEYMTEAIYLILVLKTGFCGLSFGYFLTKKRNLSTIYTVIFSVLYALSSYVVVLQNNLMWIDNVIIFPMILLAIDELISHGKFKLYVVSLVYSIVSNFYIGYMTCIFIFVWFFVRYLMLSRKERNPESQRFHFLRALGRIAFWSILSVLICAVIILPTYHALSFGKLEFTDPDFSPKQYFEFADLITKAFFGSYDSIRSDGMPFIYCGTLALVVAPLYFFRSDIPTRRKVGYIFMLMFLAVSFNLSTADIFFHGFQRPIWMNARFAYMFVALLLIIASKAVENLSEVGEKAVKISAVLWCASLVILSKIGYENLPTFLAVWPGIFLFAAVGAAVSAVIKNKDNPKYYKAASAVLCSLIIVEAIGNGVVMLYALDADVSYTRRSSYVNINSTYREAVELIESVDDDTFYRFEKLVHRKKNDSFALGIRGLSNSTSTLNARAIDLLAQLGFASRSHYSIYAGATPVTDAILGIKYVMADENVSRPVMDYIHDLYYLRGTTEKHIDVYENPYALSIAYAVDSGILNYDLPPEDPEKEEEYTDPFTYMNEFLSAMTGEDIEIWKKCTVKRSDYVGCDMSITTGHKAYKKNRNSNVYLQYNLEIDSSMPVFFYMPSDYPRDATLELNGKDIGDYFEGQDFSIRELGSFEDGDEVILKVYLEEEKMYVRSGCWFFWYFDEDEFKNAISMLEDGDMTAYSQRDDRVYGTINVPSEDGGSSVIMTTIPYDSYWNVTVDGNEVETFAVLNETLLAFEAPGGEHNIEFIYKSDSVSYGLIISGSGILIFIIACIIDKIYRKKALIRQSEELLISSYSEGLEELEVKNEDLSDD